MFQKVIGQKPESQELPPGSTASDTPSASQATPAAPSPSQHRPSAPQASAGGRNVLSSDVEIKGSIRFANDLVVDGKIDGNIDSDGALTVGENARIKAEIKTRSVVIYGKVHGNIEVTDIVELKANAELIGDIKAASLSIEPGAIFVGKSAVGNPSVQSQPKASKPSKPTATPKDSKPVSATE